MRQYAIPAFAFLALVFMSASATVRDLRDGVTDWWELSRLWLTPFSVTLAVLTGAALNAFLKGRRPPVDVLEEVGEEAAPLPDLPPSPPGSCGGTSPPTSLSPGVSLSKECLMNASQFQAGQKVSVAGRQYNGPGTVHKVEDGKVFVRCGGDGKLRSYDAVDLTAGKLCPANPGPAVAMVQPADAVRGDLRVPPVPAAFRYGDRVAVRGALYQGEATVVEPKQDGKVTVRTPDGRRFSYGRDDLAAGKVAPLPAATANAAPRPIYATAPPAAPAPRAEEAGSIRLQDGKPVRITVGDGANRITIDISRG